MRVPEVLWDWTRKQLERAKDGTGKEDVRTARAIALFPPDGVPRRIIEALWYADFGERDAPATLDAYREDPDLFADTLGRLATFSLIQEDENSQLLRLHRLDRAAILKEIASDSATRIWCRRIGEALRNCPCCTPADWAMFATCPELMKACPWGSLDSAHLTKILADCPDLQDHLGIPWHRLAVEDWWKLCERDARFFDRAVQHGIPLLPYLASQDPQREKLFNLEDFNGAAWATLLAGHPELDDTCRFFGRLTKNDLLYLLSYRPEAEAYCQHREILRCAGHRQPHPWKSNLPGDGTQWGSLLSRQPDLLAEQGQWESMTPQNILSILRQAPAFAKKCPSRLLEDINGWEWTVLVLEQPEVLSIYPSHLFPRNDPVRTWNYDNGIDWAHLLKSRPELKDRCPFNTLSVETWCQLLLLDSAYKEFDPPWDQIGPEVQVNPSFQRLFELDELAAYRLPSTGKQVQRIAPACRNPAPSLALLLHAGRRLREPSSKVPALPTDAQQSDASAASLARFGFGREYFSPSAICQMLDVPSGLDFSHLDHDWTDDGKSVCYSVDLLEEVLGEVKQLSRSDTEQLLQGMKFPQTCSSNDELFSAVLVCLYPQLAESPHIDWAKFASRELCLIMLNRPTLAKCCDWSKFSGHDWAVLLAKNPEFAPKCDWSKFSEEDWAYLHADRPWMTAAPETW